MPINQFLKLFTAHNVYKESTNEELALMVPKGDQKAFEMIYERLKVPLYQFIFQIIGNKQDALEITHDTFSKAIDNINQYRPEYKFSTWLWTIGRNITLDKLRKKDPLKYAQLENINDENESYEIEISDEYDLEEDVGFRLMRSDIQDCMDELKIEQKEVLTLQILSGMSIQEIKTVLKLNENTIKTYIHRAKKSMARCLQGKGYQNEK